MPNESENQPEGVFDESLVDELLAESRQGSPNTQVLRAAIIMEAERTPQQSAHISRQQFSRSRKPWLKLGSLAAIASMVVVIGVAVLNVPLTVDNSEVFSAEELDFQELLLVDDELIFAQL